MVLVSSVLESCSSVNPPEFVDVSVEAVPLPAACEASFELPSAVVPSVEADASVFPALSEAAAPELSAALSAELLSAAGAAACFGAASFSEESPRIWKEATAALIESSASSLFTELVMLRQYRLES